MHGDQGATALRNPPEPIRDEPSSRPPDPKPHPETTEGTPPKANRPAEPLSRLEGMSRGERLRAYRAGRLSRAERTAWAAVYPEEVPLVNGELEWIALTAE
jgi:hypothetical protein